MPVGVKANGKGSYVLVRLVPFWLYDHVVRRGLTGWAKECGLGSVGMGDCRGWTGEGGKRGKL